jgi:hypothetical protein
MMDYSTLWQKGSEYFESWVGKSGMPFTEEDRMIFVAGWIQGYLHLNQVEVCNG